MTKTPVGLAAIVAIAVACGGGGELSLEEYFQRVDAIFEEVEERQDELEGMFDESNEEASTIEESIEALQDYVPRLVSVTIQGIDEMEELDPPQDAKEAHEEWLTAAKVIEPLFEELLDGLEEVETLDQVEEFAAQFEEPEIEAASLRAQEACAGLQAVADANAIDVDLDCESSEPPAAAATPTQQPPSPTSEATPAPLSSTPTPVSTGPTVEVVNFHSVTDEFLGLEFIGEVTNTGDEDAAFVQVVLTLTDAQGNVVGTGQSFLNALSILPPGETIPFKIFVDNPPDTWAEERIQVQADPADGFSRSLAYADFEVSGVTIAPDEFGGITVRGTVQNVGSETAEFVQVTFAAFDSAGVIRAVDFTFADLDQLAPGGTSPFEILVFELDAEPTSYRIFVEGAPL